MINKIIYFIKKNPILYNLAKKVNRTCQKPMPASKFQKSIVYYSYIMKNESELEKIKENYNQIKKFDTNLFVLVDNPEYNIMLHRLIRENPEIYFASFDYFKKYRAKLSFYRMIWINYSDADRELLKYLN